MHLREPRGLISSPPVIMAVTMIISVAWWSPNRRPVELSILSRKTDTLGVRISSKTGALRFIGTGLSKQLHSCHALDMPLPLR